MVITLLPSAAQVPKSEPDIMLRRFSITRKADAAREMIAKLPLPRLQVNYTKRGSSHG
jgi:hypothetical protein